LRLWGDEEVSLTEVEKLGNGCLEPVRGSYVATKHAAHPDWSHAEALG
jgi:hypothetical protein